jgi:hypothetical protein
MPVTIGMINNNSYKKSSRVFQIFGFAGYESVRNASTVTRIERIRIIIKSLGTFINFSFIIFYKNSND